MTHELSVGDDVDKDGLLEGRESVNNLGSLLEDLVVLMKRQSESVDDPMQRHE